MFAWLKRCRQKARAVWIDTGVTKDVVQEEADGYALSLYMGEQIDVRTGMRRWRPVDYHGRSHWTLRKGGEYVRDWYQGWSR